MLIELSEIPGENDGNSTLRRAESIPFDSAGICKELLDGRILTLGNEEKGERQNFIDTDYDIGHRSIEIILTASLCFMLGESLHVCRMAYVESDARLTFASLYEKLGQEGLAMHLTRKASGAMAKTK